MESKKCSGSALIVGSMLALHILIARPVGGQDIAPTPDVISLDPEIIATHQAETEYRGRRGLTARVLDPELCRLAQVRANQIVKRWGHYNVPGGCAENIAMNNSGGVAAIGQWDRSPGHARTMYGPRTAVGFGIARSGSRSYIVGLYNSQAVSSCPDGNCGNPRSAPVRRFRWFRR